MALPWRVPAGERPGLHHLATDSAEGAPGDRATTEATFPDLHKQLRELQSRLWAENRRSVLLVLQAMDAGGKDGTIKHVFGGLNPQDAHVTSFKAPTEVELDHDFLWRVHKATPAAGETAIFNRSHYEDVLVVRVNELVPEKVWRPRYQHIRAFESLLADRGTTVVKLFLHISLDEQRERLEQRLARPDKRWKFRVEDLEARAKWDDYLTAYEDAIAETSTDAAPWYVVPADRKWYRNWAVSTILVETLSRLDPQYPEAPHLDDVVIP